MKTIEIYVACHKPAELPDNPVFVPIHVGAANAKIILPGLQRDDEGENISAKNPQYCELTGQYWAWKHSRADYIGLCHYRRYLNFTDKTFNHYTPDNRKQVLVPVLNPYTEEKYGLLDQEQIHKVVEANDGLVCTAQDLSKVYTPFGPQKTTLKHWLAHDMALINVKDLYSLFEIVERDYPQLYKSMWEYLDTKYFYGFNTFVLRRDLFQEMSAMEFDVLAKLEKQVDISHYNQQLSRIYGFMGEILFSSYVYHLQKTRHDVKIKECQMLYFNQTDPIHCLQPEKNPSLTYVIDGSGVPEFLLYPALKGLLQFAKPEKSYEIILLHDQFRPFYKNLFNKMAEGYKNVALKFQNIRYFKAEMKERYGINSVYSSSLLPWLLPKYDRCVYLHWNILIQQNLDKLFSLDLQNEELAAVRDIYYQGKLNTFFKDEKNFAEEVLDIKNIFNTVNPAVLFLDLCQIRTQTLKEKAGKLAEIEKKSKKVLREEEVFNALYQGHIQFLSARWNVLERTNRDVRFYCNEAPLDLNNAQKDAISHAVVLSYPEDAPWIIDKDEDFYLKYWSMIKNSPVEEIFKNQLAAKASLGKIDAKQITWAYINTLLPKGSERREKIKRLFPKQGFVFRHLKKLMNP